MLRNQPNGFLVTVGIASTLQSFNNVGWVAGYLARKNLLNESLRFAHGRPAKAGV